MLTRFLLLFLSIYGSDNAEFGIGKLIFKGPANYTGRASPICLMNCLLSAHSDHLTHLTAP